MVTCVPVFATHLAVKEIEAWRGVETKVGAGCPISGGVRWSSGFPAGRWGDSGDPVEFGAGCPSWLPGWVPALSSASHYDASGQDTFSAPSSCVRSLSRCHVLCAGSPGRWVEGDVSLFLLMLSCVWQQRVVSAARGLAQAAQPAELASPRVSRVPL